MIDPVPCSAPPSPSRARAWCAGLIVAGTLLVSGCGSDSPDATDTPSPSAAAEGTAGAGRPDACPAPDGSSPARTAFTEAPPMCIDPSTDYVATITTNHGVLEVALDAELAPETVNSFVTLARFHYFDATPCHRAIPGFVVQCGDPTGTGTGGPGYETPVEVGGFDTYRIGSVAMAKRTGADTNGSQFFIISGNEGASLPTEYSLFGQVTQEDLPVVAALDALGNPEPAANGVPPVEPITIERVTISPAA